MSGVILESAYYGDERAFANITQSLAKKIVGGVLEVTADAQLKPTFEAAPETRLDSRDLKRIREQAVAGCGGESDQACLNRNIIKLSEERILEKEKENLSKSVIKGDRLTINVIDNGRRRKIVTPAGQTLKLQNLIGTPVGTTDLTAMISVDKIQQQAITLITIIGNTFFWAFSVVAVYAIFMRQYEKPGAPDYWRVLAYVGTGLALLFPGFGYVIILATFAFPAFFTEYVAK